MEIQLPQNCMWHQTKPTIHFTQYTKYTVACFKNRKFKFDQCIFGNIIKLLLFIFKDRILMHSCGNSSDGLGVLKVGFGSCYQKFQVLGTKVTKIWIMGWGSGIRFWVWIGFW